MFERKKTEKKIDCPPKNENAPHNFSQRDKLSLSNQILAQTLTCSYFLPANQNARLTT